MSVVFFAIALLNIIGFIVRAHRWANGGKQFDAAVASAHLSMGILMLWATLHFGVAA